MMKRLPETQLEDFADTAALVEQMDLVITGGTSIAHLAAALGKPTWILLSKEPDWRWMAEPLGQSLVSLCTFIPATWRLGEGNWDAVLTEVREALKIFDRDIAQVKST